jgi:PAS domain S-box-containing protein
MQPLGDLITPDPPADFGDSLRRILSAAVPMLQGDAGLLVLRRGGVEFERVTHGLGLVDLEPTARLLRSRIPKLAASGAGARHFARLRSTGGRFRFVLALPIRLVHEIEGTLCIFRSGAARAFVTADQESLAGFAEQIAIAIENAWLAHQLAEEKRRVEAMLEHSADGIMTIDRDRRITGFNAALERLTGWPRRDALGRFCGEVFRSHLRSGEDVCGERCPFLRLVEHGGSSEQIESVILTRDEQPVDVAVSYGVVRSDEGDAVGGIANFRDISRLREVEELRSTFLSVISHELQTPISVIKGFASTLGREDARWTADTLRSGLAVIEEESDKLSKLVSNLLEASRLESGAVGLVKTPLELPRLVRRLMRRMQARDSGHRFEQRFAPDFPTVWAAEDRIEEVLRNLLDNAIKYAPQGTLILVTGVVRDGKAQVSVSDQGPGVPLREQERIFERFHRVDEGLTRRSPGAGLGLFICRAIVRAHGGETWVQSELGHGSTFTFTLPLGEEKERVIIHYSSPRNATRGLA